MTKRLAIVGIIVENPESAARLNAVLHEYGGSILGRMGIPLRDRGINMISVAICDTSDAISALSGKIGRIDGVNAKVTFANASFDE